MKSLAILNGFGENFVLERIPCRCRHVCNKKNSLAIAHPMALHTQVGKVPVDVNKSNISLLSISGTQDLWSQGHRCYLCAPSAPGSVCAPSLMEVARIGQRQSGKEKTDNHKHFGRDGPIVLGTGPGMSLKQLSGKCCVYCFSPPSQTPP